MHALDVLGSVASSFTCSGTGTCTGTTQTTQRAFIALQTQVNRVGVGYGITRLSTDGKLGPQTLLSTVNLAKALQRKLGASIDPIIEQIIFGFGDGAPTTTRDLALSAEAITDALTRDGAAPQVWSVLQSIKDMAQQVIATGNVQPSVPPMSLPTTPINPYPVTATPTTPSPVTAYPPMPTTWPGWNTQPVTTSPGWKIPPWAYVVAGVSILALAVGITVAITKR